MMDDPGKSHSSIVPKKSPNKAPSGAAEGTEGRELANGKTLAQSTLRTQSREGVQRVLERIRDVLLFRSTFMAVYGSLFSTLIAALLWHAVAISIIVLDTYPILFSGTPIALAGLR
jgi:hypothetical protein